MLFNARQRSGFHSKALTAKNTSEFPKHIQQEIREKYQNYALKDLVQEYGLSEQTMRSTPIPKTAELNSSTVGMGVISILIYVQTRINHKTIFSHSPFTSPIKNRILQISSIPPM